MEILFLGVFNKEDAPSTMRLSKLVIPNEKKKKMISLIPQKHSPERGLQVAPYLCHTWFHLFYCFVIASLTHPIRSLFMQAFPTSPSTSISFL